MARSDTGRQAHAPCSAGRLRGRRLQPAPRGSTWQRVFLITSLLDRRKGGQTLWFWGFCSTVTPWRRASPGQEGWAQSTSSERAPASGPRVPLLPGLVPERRSGRSAALGSRDGPAPGHSGPTLRSLVSTRDTEPGVRAAREHPQAGGVTGRGWAGRNSSEATPRPHGREGDLTHHTPHG